MNFIEAVKEMKKGNLVKYQDGSKNGEVIRYSHRTKQFMKDTEEYGWYKIDFDEYYYTSDSWELLDSWNIQKCLDEKNNVNISHLKKLKNNIIEDINDEKVSSDSYNIDLEIVEEILKKRFGF